MLNTLVSELGEQSIDLLLGKLNHKVNNPIMSSLLLVMPLAYADSVLAHLPIGIPPTVATGRAMRGTPDGSSSTLRVPLEVEIIDAYDSNAPPTLSLKLKAAARDVGDFPSNSASELTTRNAAFIERHT